MFLIKIVATLAICSISVESYEILVPKVVLKCCLTKVLNKIVEKDKCLVINSPEHNINDSSAEEIFKILRDKMKLVVNSCRAKTTKNNWQVISKPDTIFILASTRKQIVTQTKFLRNAWSILPKIIVVYLEKRKNRPVSLTKNIFQTLTHLNASSVHLLYMFDDDISEFTWFPYEDGNCDRVDRVRLISECKSGSHRIQHTRKLESKCTIRPTIGSKNAGYTEGIEIELTKALARWSNFNVEFTNTSKSEFEKGYIPTTSLDSSK